MQCLHLEPTLSVFNRLDSKEPDTGVEAEHEDGPHGGPAGDAVLLQVGPGPAHQALAVLVELLQHPLQLDQVSEGGGAIRVSEEDVVSPAVIINTPDGWD